MPSPRSIRRIFFATGMVLVLAVFVPPLVKLKSLRRSLVESIGGALGRQVSVREVRLRLFPQPGFELRGFVVQDDPAFSAEPMLRAEEVTANLRLSSLWRWRPEISSLALKSPSGAQPWSLNVVRRADGRWNLQSLLTRATQTPSAPTAKPRPETRPRFPYLEGDGGRINFKSGVEKKVYALNEADFALWLASESEWNVRLRARPMRTDANLSDTGIVEIGGAFGRTARLEETPLRLRISLRGAQLGQLTRFVYGRDRGWRGAVSVTADLTGTPRDLQLSSSVSIDDFRRYDIIIPDSLRLVGSCTAQYRFATQELSNVDCRARNGEITLRGDIKNLLGSREYHLELLAQRVPMPELARLLRHVKFALSPDLTAAGTLNARFTYGQQGWVGDGGTSDLVLRSRVFGQELALGSIKFELGRENPTIVPRTGVRYKPAATVASGGKLRLVLSPFEVPLGGTTASMAQVSFSATDYAISIGGDAELQRLFRVARGLGLHAPALRASGSVKLNLQMAGNWTGFNAPVVTGSIQLRNTTVFLAGVRPPAQLRTATALLLPDRVRVEKLVAGFTGSHIAVDGSLVLPRDCGDTQPCPVQFDLHSGQVSLEELNRFFNPQLQRVPWYRVLAGNTVPSMATFAAQGRIRADHVMLRGLELEHLVAEAALRDRSVRLSEVRAEVLGGKMRAEWSADFSGNAPAYSGSGTLERIALAQLAALMNDPWAVGTGSGRFKLKLSGWSAPDLTDSAAGTLDFDWQNGTLPHLVLNDTGAPLRIKHFTGHAVLRDRRLEFQQSRIDTASGVYLVSGTASPARLELKMADPKSSTYAVSGSLRKPLVTVLSQAETQAALGK